MSETSLGALPPPGHEWEAGKTAASVAFVNQAEDYLFNVDDPRLFTELKEQIDKVKSGEVVLNEWVDDIEAYVENL